MTTDPPSTPPVPPLPWLKFECFEEESGKTYYSLARGANEALFEAVRGQSAWKTLEDWAVVRSRISEALGLVEPEAVRSLVQQYVDGELSDVGVLDRLQKLFKIGWAAPTEPSG